MSTPTERRQALLAARAAEKRQALIEDIEFLVEAGAGEARILQATGYADKPDALQRRLTRCKRHDLIPRIFQWQAAVDERQHPKAWAR
jgi:hypothetical protein